MKLATSSGDFVRYTYSIAEAVKNFQDTKFRYVNLELGRTYAEAKLSVDEAVERLQEAAEYAGVTYSTSHSPIINAFAGDQSHYENAVREIARSIEISGRLGISGIVIHSSFNPVFSPSDFYRENKRFYTEFFDLMEKYNVVVMTENMATFDQYFLSTGREMREFAEYVDHPLFGLCWDTAHGNLNERARALGQYENIIAMGDKLKGLHIADNFGDGAHHHTFPFAGIINFDEVMQGLMDVHYGGYFTYEAAYTLMHHTNLPYRRQNWEHNGQVVEKLFDPPVALKKKAVDLLYDVGEHILKTYDCYEI